MIRRSISQRRRQRFGRRPAVLESLEPRHLLAGDVLIAEVMSSNDSTIKDEDGSYSDWLELYNTSLEPVDLNGWHLTDRANDRTQWTFPQVTLDPGSSLLVFASGKDKRDPAGQLHTNFRLSEGEYLGLFQPDGRTASYEISALPTQYADISYGIGQLTQERVFVDAGSSVRALLPANAGQDLPASSWTATDFNDASWATHQYGVGFDQDPSDGDFGPLISASGNLLAMQGKTASAYLRSEFQIAGDTLPIFKSMGLDVNYDDGFVAYLNGTEVARVNAPDTLAWNSTATQSHGGIAADISYPDFSSGDDRGEFTLLGNASWNGNRLQVTPAQADQTGAAWLTSPVPFGSTYSFSASMAFDIHSPGGGLSEADADGIGGEGMTFVLQGNDNNVLGSGGGGLGIENTGSSFVSIELDSQSDGTWDPDNALPSHLGIVTSAAGNVARVAIPRFNGNAFFPGTPGPGVVTQYLWVEYDGETQTLDVYYASANVKPDTPTLSATVDLANLFADTPALYAGWTAATSQAFNGHDVLAWNIRTGLGEIGREAEFFDLSDHVDLLKPGKNVLAIHGLNVAAGEEDFLVLPKLTAEEVVLGDVGYFAAPTPGALNGPSDLAPSGDVMFSEPTRVFVSPFNLIISAENVGATIRYTTDGSLPTETSTVYTGPISVNEPMRIRARSFEPNRSGGPVNSVGFIQLDTSLVNFENGKAFESNLPIIVFDSFGDNVHQVVTDRTTRTEALHPSVGIFFDPGEDGRVSLLDEPEYAGRTGLRIRGQSSQDWPKRQYAVEFWDEGNDDSAPLASRYAPDKSVSIFGLPADSDWVLNGPYSDKTQLNNFLTFNWFREVGLYAPRARLVEVFVNQNATAAERSNTKLNYSQDYRGTYVLLEKIKIDENRVDINELELGDVAEPEITGGYLWKKDKSGLGDRPFRTSRGQELRMVEPQDPPPRFEPEPGDIVPEQKTWLTNYINEFEAALYGPDFADPKIGYAKYIDVDSWVDTWLLVEFTKNIDGFRLSTYYHKDLNGKIKQGPAWDFNLSLANGNYLNGGRPQGWYSSGLNDTDYPYWRRLFEDPSFKQRVADRWFELRQTVLEESKLMADIDAAVNALSNGNPRLTKPAAGEPSNPISRNYARWTNGGYGESVYFWPNCFFGQGDGCPASPLPAELSPNGRPNSYDDYIYIMKWFVDNRLDWIDSQFLPPVQATPPSGVVPRGTTVTLSASPGYEIYYSLEGKDPAEPYIVEEVLPLLDSGAAASIHVPANGSLIDFCDDGILLPTSASCFMNPAYVEGTNGETWTAGTTPVGYDTTTDYDAIIASDIEASMRGKNSSVYLRIPFDIDQETLSRIDQLTMKVRYDDGFAAYLWVTGVRAPVELARANAPGEAEDLPINALAYNAAATAGNPDQNAVAYQTFDITASKARFRAGRNYLIVQALNQNKDDEDFLFDVKIEGIDTRVEIDPTVLRYTGPISIDRNTQLKTRGFNQTKNEWTSLATLTYLVERPQVAITELNYNPYDPTALELAVNPDLTNDDFEFIEVQNVGPVTVNLAGLSFEGIDFTFSDARLTPGERGVVVKNQQAFVLRYGPSAKVLGEFEDGSLNNNGETIGVNDPFGNSILEFRYDDNDPWAQSADGNGATLELISPAFATAEKYGKYYSWRGSTNYGGSPGTAGSAPLGVVLNEVLANTTGLPQQTDSIELLNTTNQPIDISGWYLSDAAGDRLKFKIPAATILGPGQYVVFNESHFNADPNNPKSFALSGRNGDDVWLTIADVNGRVTHLVDDIHFGATLAGESLGRVPNGQGRLAPLQTRSLGTDNGAPRVGPVVITEVQYNPGEPTAADRQIEPTLTSSDLEFVEITNPTANQVDLTDWRLRGGVDYNFYPNESLAAGGRLLIVPFNPDDVANTNRVAAFRNHYGLSADVRLEGGYDPTLSSNGDRLTLLRPDTSLIGEPFELPRVQEDEVVYDNLVPWPTGADGTGKSLQRRGDSAFGNDPLSWLAATPTPGRANVDASAADFNGDGTVNEADINLLFEQLRAVDPDLGYDLTGDGLVNADDRDYLIFDILGTTYGDADLNRLFNSSDFVTVFLAGEYEDGIPLNSTWGEGDWNGDGEFSSGDFIIAFLAGGYETAARVADTADISQPDVIAAIEADRILDVKQVDAPLLDGGGLAEEEISLRRRPWQLDSLAVTDSVRDRDRYFELDAEDAFEELELEWINP